MSRPQPSDSRLGTAVCGTDDLLIQRSDGHFEYFVVGTDNAVWHAFDDANGEWHGWYSLGGQASQGVFLWSQPSNGPSPATTSSVNLAVVGAGNGLYCTHNDSTQPSGWTGWNLCGY